MPEISPLFDNGDIVSDYLSKAELFNSYFALQCTPLDDNDEVPSLCLRTPLSLSTIKVSEEQILYMIRVLDPNKACCWDGISSHMIKIGDSSIVSPLEIMFDTCICERTFAEKWKMSNICPIHKKELKNVKENYRPISLLPILGKMFEKVIFDSLYDYFVNNKLPTPRQSGFIEGDSYVNQLLAITHEIHKHSDTNPSIDTIGVFLDMSKAFDKVWHNGLVCKLNPTELSPIYLHS